MQETATAVFAERITCVFRNLVESMTIAQTITGKRVTRGITGSF
jgi:hypothetical protein